MTKRVKAGHAFCARCESTGEIVVVPSDSVLWLDESYIDSCPKCLGTGRCPGGEVVYDYECDNDGLVPGSESYTCATCGCEVSESDIVDVDERCKVGSALSQRAPKAKKASRKVK